MAWIFSLSFPLLIAVVAIVLSRSGCYVSAGQTDYAEKLMNSGRYQEALQIFVQSLATAPSDIFSMQGAAICYSNLGRLDLAGGLFEKAAISSNNDQLFYNAGMSYHQMGDYKSALRNYNMCVTLNRAMRHCHIKLASIYRDMDDPMNTQRHLLIAIQIEPGNPDAYSYLADTYNNLKQFQLAIDSYEKVLKIVGMNDMMGLKTLISMGDTYTNMKLPENSYTSFEKALTALSMAPPNAQSQIQSDLLYSNVGLFFAAMEMGYWKNYEKLSALIVKLASSYNKKYEKNRKQIEKNSRKQTVGPPLEPMNPNPLSPYRLMFLDAPENLYRDISNQWAQQTHDSATTAAATLTATSKGEEEVDRLLVEKDAKINIGYISRRLYNYPGTQMMIRLFPLHDRQRVTVHSLANGPDDSSKYREFIRNNSDVFMDITNYSFVDSIVKIDKLNLDVLIDYDGIHDFNSLKLLSQLNSVVKITWLGYAGTSAGGGARKHPKGMSTAAPQYSIEYVISDKNILSPDIAHTQVYKEKLIYLPYSYQPQDEFRGENITDLNRDEGLSLDHCVASGNNIVDLNGNSIPINIDLSSQSFKDYFSNRISDRKWLLNHFKLHESLGLSSISRESFNDKVTNAIWLICFNRLSKITPDAFGDWLSILNQHPNTVLVLMKDSASAQAHVVRVANFMGVRSDRILFIPRVNSLYLYRAILRTADYFLDTRHYNSHTVASDSMMERTPIIAIQGATFASRVSSSLNEASDVNFLRAMNLHSRMEFADLLSFLLKHKGDTSHKISFIIKKSIDSMIKCGSSCKSRKLFNSPQFTRFMEYAAFAARELKSITLQSPSAAGSSIDSASELDKKSESNGGAFNKRFHIITGSSAI